MKKLSKILAFLLAFSMAFSMVAFAEEVQDGTSDEIQGDVMLISEEAGEPVETEEAVEESEEVLDGTTDEVQDDVMLISEESEVFYYEPELLNLGDCIGKAEDWISSSEGYFAIEDGKVKNTGDGTIYFSNNTVDFENFIVQYKANLKFPKNSWGGFVLRSTLGDAPIWEGGTGYLVVIKNDRIELQRWSNAGQKILTVVPNDYVKDGIDCNITAGAVDCEAGVNVFMFVDGVCVLNIFDDDENAIREGQYFTLYANGKAEFSAFDGEAIANVPCMITSSGKAVAGEKFSANYSIVSFGEEVVDEYDVSWYYCDEIEGKNFTELQQNAKYEFTSKYIVDGEFDKLATEGKEHTVAEEEIGGYYKVAVSDAEGNILARQLVPVVSHSVAEILDSSIALLINCEFSYVSGEKVQIDPDDYSVRPDIVDGRTLVPVRFIAESYGAEVLWDDATKKVTIKLDGKEICFVLNQKSYTIDGVETALDVPAQVMYDRTMVPIRVVSEAFGKTVFWDNDTRLIIISSEDLGLDSNSDKISINEIYNNIQKVI